MNGKQELSYLDISTTYANWNSEFSQILLAYTGHLDVVECTHCGIKLGQWKNGDNVQERHFKASPSCKFSQEFGNMQNNRRLTSNSPGGQFGQFQSDNLRSDRNTLGEGNNERREIRSQFAPSRSESRLPVPVNIIQDGGFRYNPNKAVEQSDTDDNVSMNIQQQKTMPRAQIAKYQEESARLASFENWPDSAPVKPPALARAGLYYTTMGDKVKCPFCLGSMYNWEVGDVPFAEHARHYPACAFVKYRTYENLFPNNSSSESQRAVSDSDSSKARPAPVENKTQAIAAGGRDGNFENNKSVKIVHQMGFSMEAIRAAIERISGAITSDSLIDKLYEMEDNDESDHEGEVTKSAPQSLHLSIKGEGDQAKPLEGAAVRDYPTKPAARESEQPDSAEFAGGNRSGAKAFTTTDDDFLRDYILSGSQPTANQEPRKPMNSKHKKLSEEHNKLTKKKLCHICGEDEVSVLFLPCRHLIACETCSAAMKDCAQCDKLIIGTVKIYFP